MVKRHYVIKVKRKLRRAGANGATIEITTPKNAINRELRRYGLKNIDQAEGIWEYNNFDGLHLKIVPKESEPR